MNFFLFPLHRRIVPTFPLDGGTIRWKPFKNPYFPHIFYANGFGNDAFFRDSAHFCWKNRV